MLSGANNNAHLREGRHERKRRVGYAGHADEVGVGVFSATVPLNADRIHRQPLGCPAGERFTAADWKG